MNDHPQTVPIETNTDKKVAWMVEIQDRTCIVFASTKAKAQWIATSGYWEAYGKNMGWPRAVAWRAKVYDRCVLRHGNVRAYSEERVIDSPND